MLVAGLLAAVRLGACENTGGFATYVHLNQGSAYTIAGNTFPNLGANAEVCARNATMDEVYAGPHPCLVSHAYKCCFNMLGLDIINM